MATRPTINKPDWFVADDTKLNEPSSSKKIQGWSPQEPLPAQNENWLLRSISEWLDYLDDAVSEGGSGGGSGSGAFNYYQSWYQASQDLGDIEDGLTDSIDVFGRQNPNAWGCSDLTKISFTKISVSPLRETTSYFLDQIAPGSGLIETPLVNLNIADLGQILAVTGDSVTSASITSYDVIIARYNSSNILKELIPITGIHGQSSDTIPSARILNGTGRVAGFFQAGTEPTDKYAIRYRKLLSSVVGIYLDSFYMGPALSNAIDLLDLKTRLETVEASLSDVDGDIIDLQSDTEDLDTRVTELENSIGPGSTYNDIMTFRSDSSIVVERSTGNVMVKRS